MDDKGYFKEFQKKDIDPSAISFVVISIPNGTVYPYDCLGKDIPGIPACRELNCPNLRVPADKAAAEGCWHAMHIRNFQQETTRFEKKLAETGHTLMVMIK